MAEEHTSPKRSVKRKKTNLLSQNVLIRIILLFTERRAVVTNTVHTFEINRFGRRAYFTQKNG